ncbi:MAG TPA: CDP-alcohol phosphatidyltransferase family protein [Anaerolineae bacterium]|nr:CDP-alcohol phosphatidyltransferase family protein [Anaerolineae bacterium]
MGQKPVSEEKTTLTDFFRAKLAFIINPIADGLARLGVTADMVTWLSLLTHFGFAWLVAQGELRWAGVAIALVSPLDAIDGTLARRSGQGARPMGAFLDSTFDRLAEIVLFAGFGYYFYTQEQILFMGLTYLALTGSLMVSYARARGEALGFECKVGIMTRVERYLSLAFFLVLEQPEFLVGLLAVLTYFTVGQRMLHIGKQAKND